MFYLVIFVILAILALLNLQFRDKFSTQILMAVGSVILILVAGLRYETGGDWDTYASVYNGIAPLQILLAYPHMIVEYSVEEAFVLLCALVKALGGDIQTLFFIITLFDVSLIAAVLPRYTKMPVVGLLAYYAILYFNLEMIYLRQAMAVALCFFSLQYVEQKSLWRFVLVVIFASLFHRVALMILPLYFVLDKKLPIWLYSVIIGVGCVVMLLGVPWIKTIFMTVSGWLGEDYADKAETYTENARFAVNRVLSIGFYINIALFVCLMLFKNRIDKMPHGTIHMNMFIISLVLYYYCYELVEVSNRTRMFFLISVIVVLPHLLECMSGFMSRLIAYVPVVVYCFTFAMGIMLERPEAAAYNPYQNYLVYKWTGKPSTGKERLEQSHRNFTKERKR